jgi:flagellar biosynthesis protein FlgN
MTIASPDATLATERLLIESLTGLLREEQRLLVEAHTDGLAALTPQKAECVRQLGEQAALRHQALGAAGCEASEAGMGPWLDANGAQQARASWERLLEATREAKELNRVNGMLINKHMAHNQQLLDALRTTAAGADTTMYGPGGEKIAGGPSRRFVLG